MAVAVPTLEDLKSDLRRSQEDVRDEDRLERVLAAAIAFAARIHPGYDWSAEDSESASGADSESPDLPEVPDDIALGVIRLAARWHTRGRSPDGMINMADIGSFRVTSGDVDIDRLLRIGRFRHPVIA